MHLVRWIAHRLIGLALTTTGAVLVAGIASGLGIGFFCMQGIGPENAAPSSEPFPSVDTVCRALLKFGLTCVVTAIAMLVAWVASRALKSGAGTSSATTTAPDDGSAEQGGAVAAVGLALTVLPITVILGARPAISFIDRNRELWSGQLDGILLMVPMFELVIMATCLVAGIGLLLLFATRDRMFPRAYAVLVTAQLGLLVTSHQALAVTRSVTAFLEGQVPVVDDHVAAVESTNRHLSWALAAYAALLPVALLSPSVRRRFAARSFASTAMDVPPSHEPPAADPPARIRPMAEPGQDVSLQSSRYFVHATYLAAPFGGRLKLQDLDLNRGYVAQVAPLSLRTTVQVHRDRSGSPDVLRIEARQALSFGGLYDVFDAPSREKIGVIRWRFAADWLLYDPLDREIGLLTASGWSLGQGAFQARIGPHEVGTLSWSNVLRPTLELDYSMDADQRLDRRLGVALGILLFLERSTRGPRVLGP